MTYTAEQLRENELQNELLLDNAATCSQHPALEEPTVRECIVLNIVNPLRVAYAWAADEMDAYKDAAEKRMNERDAALEELAALREQLAERDAEIAALKGHAMEVRRRIEGIANWRVEAHKYDADMDNEPRTFCEDVELIEQAAQDALAAFPKE